MGKYGTHKVSGIPVGISPMTTGTVYFVDPNNGNDGNTGLKVNTAFETLTKAFTVITHYDTIICAAGNYTGNYTTPNNATASFVRLIGFRTGDIGSASWAGATTASSPIIDVIARGWTITDFEFDCPTGSSGIRLTKNVSQTSRCDFTHIERCIFTTGKYGIEVNGGGTHVRVKGCKFDQLTETGAFGIHVTATGFQIPAFWVVEDNIFATSLNHIGPGNATYGWNESTFRNNVHQTDSGTDATTVCDVRASSGTGNMVLGNYFDIAKASFTADTTVRGNTTDFAAGNWFLDGAQQEAMNVS